MSGIAPITLAASGITPQIAALQAAPSAIRQMPNVAANLPRVYAGTAARNFGNVAPLQPTCLGCA